MNNIVVDEVLVSRLLEGARGPDIDAAIREVLYGAPVETPSDVRERNFPSIDPNSIRDLRCGDRWVSNSNPNIWFPDYRDAKNYIFLKKEQMDDIIRDLNERAKAGDHSPQLLAFFTGGTLAMTTGEDGILRPAKGAKQLLEFAGHGLNQKAYLGIVETPMIDSSDMKTMLISEIVGAYHYILRHLSPEARSLSAGVVIGHGTDTAAATGALIRVMHTAYDTSVGLVAAQNASDNPLPDGPSNIAATICSLIEMKRLETAHLFCHTGGGFAGELLGLGWFTKISDRSKIIFGSRGYPKICDLRESSIAEGLHGGTHNRRADTLLAPVMLDGSNPVKFSTLHQNEDAPGLLTSIAQSDAPYFAVTSFGAGTAPQDVIRALLFAQVILEKKAERTGQPLQQIFVNTLFTDADLQHTYESNQQLRESGIPVLCATEDLINARAMLARTVTADPKEQKRIIVNSMNGDYPPHYGDYIRKEHPELWLPPTARADLAQKFTLKNAS